MYDKCRFNPLHVCDIWLDYQIALHSLEEAEELSYLNWLEIQHLYDRVSQLERFIISNGLSIPQELD